MRDEENRLAKEAAGADEAEKAEEECAAREAAELAARLRGASGKRRSSTSNQDGQEQRLAPEAAQEAEEERPMHAGPCRTSHLVRRLQPLQQLAPQRLPLESVCLG